MRKQYNYAVERLNNIDWSIVGEKKNGSNILLLLEYYRRVAKFYDSLKVKKIITPVYFPIAKILKLEYNIKKPDIDIYEVCPTIKEINRESVHYLCENYVELAMLVDEGVELAISYKDIYDPIIRLFEKGGCYRNSHDNGYETDGGSIVFSIANLKKLEEIDISNEGLEYYEETGIKRFKV